MRLTCHYNLIQSGNPPVNIAYKHKWSSTPLATKSYSRAEPVPLVSSLTRTLALYPRVTSFQDEIHDLEHMKG